MYGMGLITPLHIGRTDLILFTNVCHQYQKIASVLTLVSMLKKSTSPECYGAASRQNVKYFGEIIQVE